MGNNKVAAVFLMEKKFAKFFRHIFTDRDSRFWELNFFSCIILNNLVEATKKNLFLFFHQNIFSKYGFTYREIRHKFFILVDVCLEVEEQEFSISMLGFLLVREYLLFHVTLVAGQIVPVAMPTLDFSTLVNICEMTIHERNSFLTLTTNKNSTANALAVFKTAFASSKLVRIKTVLAKKNSDCSLYSKYERHLLCDTLGKGANTGHTSLHNGAAGGY
jgi:hypothetical protein